MPTQATHDSWIEASNNYLNRFVPDSPSNPAVTCPTEGRGDEAKDPNLALRFWRGVSVPGTGGVMADWDGIPARERRQMEEILQLDMEELNVEVVDEEEEEEEQGDGDNEEDDVEAFLRANDGEGVASTSGPFTFNASLASLHTYLGDVDDTRGRVSLLDGGRVINLPMFYLQGVVLFPGATLPLRVIRSRLKTAVDKALNLVDAPCTIGVVLLHPQSNHRHYNAATVGTTAEIRQLGRLNDGSLNVVARGQQRFRLRRHWIDVDRVVWGEVQIIEEDTPLRTPRDAFAQLAACNRFNLHSSPVISLDMSPIKKDHIDSELECDTPSPKSNASNHSSMDTRLRYLSSQSSDSMKSSSDEEGDLTHHGQKRRSVRESGASSHSDKKTNMSNEDDLCLTPLRSLPTARTRDIKRQRQYHAYSKQASRAPLSLWPQWVYEMYDSYTLARRAAELWRQIIAKPSMDDHVRKPDILSFHIGSKLPVSESVRQKLLEIDGISYRLQREIQLLKAFNLIKCRNCQVTT
nr:unnamed protein product [Digitaria exilis]